MSPVLYMCYGNKMRVKFRQSWVNIEKNNRFVDRVLILSVPAALVLVFLAVLDIISPLLAVFSYAAIVMFNLIFLLPVTVELQQLRRYISSLASGGEVRDDAVALSESETKEIVRAVNAMHRFWTQKADSLEAQSISDAAVLDTLPDPIMMIDRAGNIIGANLSSRALFGENITDKNIDHLIESNNFVEAVSRVLKKESESENLIFYTQKPFSQKLYAHIKSLPWQSKGRAVAVISLYDMTKSMRIEKMQSDFVANASHELRTPLAIISGFIETLLKFFYPGFDGLSAFRKEELISSLQFAARKSAHCSIYGVLGVFSFLTFVSYRRIAYSARIIISLAVCLIWAVSDEIHQLFVDGRSCEFRDMAIDWCGVFFGIAVFYILRVILCKIKSKKKNKF